MDERLLQVVTHEGEGYKPVMAYQSWRVAFLNAHPRFMHENLTQLERHLLSDEAFLLLRGRAALYIGDGDGEHAGHITVVPLEAGRLYNVRAGVWHAIETDGDASVLIVENDDTCQENSPKLNLAPGELPPWAKEE